MANRLSGRRLRFAQEYVIDFDVTKAAERAGFAPSGARGNGGKCLRDRRVQEEIARLRQAALPDITRKSLLTELHDIYSDRNTAPMVRIMAIKEAAALQHLHEDEQAVPDEITVILRRDKHEPD